MKKFVAILLTVVLLTSMAQVTSYAIEPTITLTSAHSYRVDGEANPITLAFDHFSEPINSIEFLLDANPNVQIQSISYNGVTLSGSNPYGMTADMIGMMSDTPAGKLVAFSKLHEGTFTQPLNITLDTKLINTSSDVHVKAVQIVTSNLLLLNADGDYINAPVIASLTQKVLTQSIQAKLVQTQNLSDALPVVENITLEHKHAVETTRTSFDALITMAGTEVDFIKTLFDETKLVTCEDKIDQLILAATTVKDEILALPAKDQVVFNDKVAIEDVSNHYQALDTLQKTYVTAAAVAKLEDCLKQLTFIANGKATLAATITAADDLKALHPVGIKEGNVSQATMTAFETAISTAKTFAVDVDLKTLAQISSATTTLQTARTTFVANIYTTKDEKKADLQKLVSDCEALKEEAVVGTSVGEYPQTAVDALTTMITYAKAKLTNASATIDDYNDAISKLSTEKVKFESSKITALDVAKKQLSDKIVEAETLLATGPYGDGLNQYPLSSKTALQNAILTAKSVELTNVTVIDNGKATLQSAIDTFKDTKITAEDLATKDVAALFTDNGKTVLAANVTLTLINQVKAKVNALSASATKTALLEDITTAEGLFNTPAKVTISASVANQGVGNLQKGLTQQLVAKTFNSLNIELTNKSYAWTSSSAGVVTVTPDGLIQGINKGMATVTAIVKDGLGNNTNVKKEVSISVFEVPDLIVSNIAPNSFFKQSVMINAYRDGQDIEIKEGNTTLGSGNGSATATVSAAGPHTIVITSGSGMNLKQETLTFYIDLTSPTITIPVINNGVDAPVTIPTVTYNDANLLVTSKELYLEKKEGNTFTYYKAVSTNDEVKEAGSYRLVAFVKDLAGNEARATKEFTITYDMGLPTITVTGISGINTTAVTPVVTLNGGTNKGNYYYVGVITRPDQSKTNIKTGDVLPTLNSAGSYTLEVKAYNPNNANQFSSFTQSFVIDLAVPTIQVSGVNHNGKYNTSVTPIILVQDTDGIDTETQLYQNAVVTLTKNGTSISYSKGNTISAEGTYVLTVNAKDGANKSAVPVSVGFVIDKTKPTITMTNIAQGEVYFTNIVSTITTDSDVASFTLKDSDGNNIVLTNNTKTFLLVSGQSKSYTVNATATDHAGNVTTKQVTFAIDGLDVVFNVIGISEGAKLQMLPNNIVCKAIDGASEYVIEPEFKKGDNSAFTGSDGPQKMILSYTKGQTVYTKTINFILDSTTPTVSNIKLLVNSVEKNANVKLKAGDLVTLRATVIDASTLVMNVYATIGSVIGSLTLNPKGNDVFEGSFTVGTGNYVGQEIKIYGTDQGGNTKLVTSYQLTVDNTVPMVNFSIKPSELPNGSNQYYITNTTKVYLSSNDPTAKIYYSFNGSNSTEYVNPLSPIDGNNSITYYAVDEVGNQSEAKTKTFLYDATAPAAITALTPANAVKLNTPYITISGKVVGEANKGTKVVLEQNGYIIGSTLVGIGDSFEFTDIRLSEGSNTYTLYAVDFAGNKGAISTRTIELDTTPPVIQVVQTSDTTYTVSVNEAINGGLTVLFNNSPAGVTVNGLSITTPQPASGQNMLIVTATDTTGNVGTGSLSTNYMPPNTAQEDVKVTDNTSLDIPANAFGQTTVLTVQTVDVEGTTQYRTLGAPIQYSFTVNPTEPIIITSFVGIGLTGVGIIHISDDGVIDEFVPAIEASPIDFNNLVEDQPYYDPTTGNLVLRTKDFSTYQLGQDVTPPAITITTTDYEISHGESASIAGTFADQDPDVKLIAVTIDNVKQVVSLGSPFNYSLTLTDGSHEVAIEVKDAAGNSSTISKTYTVDKTIPVLNGTVVAATTDQEIGTIDLNISELVELRVNNTLISSAQGVTSIQVDLSLGSNSFVITGKDAFGNIGTQTITINRIAVMALTVDALQNTTAATINITGSINVTANIYVNDQIKLTNQPAGNFTVVNYPLVIGVNTIQVKALDALGNERLSQVLTVTRTATQDGGNQGGGGGILIPGDVTTSLPVVEEEDEDNTALEVSSQGGLITFETLGIQMEFDVNTFDEDVQVSAKEVVLEGSQILFEDGTKVPTTVNDATTRISLAGKVYELSASEQLNKPVTITFTFDKETMTEEEISRLGVYYLNQEKGQWEYVPGIVDFERGTITVVLEHFSIYAIMHYYKTFTDIKDSWAKSIIEDLASRHIINGISQTQYAPNRNMTRAEFATLIVKALGLKASSTKSSFGDVKSSDWFATYVMAAKEANIISGYPDNSFKPYANITREQMAVMIMNAYQYKFGVDYKKVYTGQGYQFADQAKVSVWAVQAVEGTKMLGIVNGKGNNVFDPLAYATRAEVAKMIQSLLALD